MDPVDIHAEIRVTSDARIDQRARRTTERHF
jgi:hypothetical protein